MAREIAGLGSAREQLFAMLRAYIDHGVENPALYSLMFGGYLSGPDHRRPAIELAEAEKTKALLAGFDRRWGSRTRHRAYLSQRTEDCGCDSCLLVARPWHHLLIADGFIRPKKKSVALADRLVQGMLDGLSAELPMLPPGTWVGPGVPHQ